MDYDNLLLLSIQAAVIAGVEILDVYDTKFSVEYKDDKSPLTLADKKSHEIISSKLTPTGIPVLSEEGRQVDYEERRQWKRLWIVDPLDGTKEFVKRNGEFTVNIALVEHGKPVLGVIYAPVTKTLYFAGNDQNAYRLEYSKTTMPLAVDDEGQKKGRLLNELISRAEKLPAKSSAQASLTIVGSRSHVTPALESYVAKMREKYSDVKFVSAGSSLKFCRVAEGEADIYPKLGPTMEWDTAAGQVIAEHSGASVLVYDTNEPLTYNREDLLNPWYIVRRKT